MQNRYAGDIGDYGKIGLLKCLQLHGFKIGVNCYRVPDHICLRYMTYEEHIFLEVESESFIEGCSFEDYKQDVIRYLMLCSYKYSEKRAKSLVNRRLAEIKRAYIRKDPVADIAIDIGYACG
ncbi:MAG: hypothetical protein IKH67_06570 [Lachnospiraceae bacterium]|nr:hypothetical protein [Lachnospiraceae bacterium]